MAHEIGLSKLHLVANKITSPEDETFVREALPELPLLGAIPMHDAFAEADRKRISPLDILPEDVIEKFRSILSTLKKEMTS